MENSAYYYLILTLLSLGATLATTNENACIIDLDLRKGKYQPFILNGKDDHVIYPENNRIIKIENGDTVVLDCHGSKIKQSSEQDFVSGLAKVHLTCVDQKWFSGEHTVNVEYIECESMMFPSLQRISKICSPIGTDGRTTDLESLVEVHIGFNFTRHYSHMITLCHDEKNYGTIWTRHVILGKSIDLRDGSSYRPSFRTNVRREKKFYSFTTMTEMNSKYSKSVQAKTVRRLLGHNSIVVDGVEVPIIENTRSGTNYFAKGHLSPDAAFIYIPQQDATYFYLNAAPQFQSFNNRNWKSIEFKARNWAAKNGIELEVYTGTHGVLEFPDTMERLVKIYLFPKRSFVPAPKYYWKVLYNANANEAIAFVGLNNPYERTVPKDLCSSVCSQTYFNDPDFFDFKAGYILCCEVSELKSNILSIPNLSKEGIWPELMGKVAVTTPPPIIKGCQINLNELNPKYPPIITYNGKFIYPTLRNKKDERITIVPEGSEATMFCQRSRGISLLFKDESRSKIKSLTMRCLNEQLLHEGEPINPNDYRCSHLNQPVMNIQKSSTCATEGVDKRKTQLERITHVSLGWGLLEGFLEQIEICIDELFYGTLWTKYTVHGRNIDLQDVEAARIGFKVDETGKKRFFGGRSTSKIDRHYAKSAQKKTIKKITGHTMIDGETIIETGRSGTRYFARGHLSPDAGFVNYAEQLGTYFYINAAPQLQSFNNGNWKALEMTIRSIADKLLSDIEVYTGTYDSLTLFGKKILLLEEKFIPVPLYFWKVMYLKDSQKAVAFVGLNDIYRKTPPAPLCKDICSQLSWVDWDIKTISKGYMYCCEVEDLRSVISYVPALDASLLTEI